MKKIIREPFLHFLLIGAALFLIYGLVSNKSTTKNTILINDFDISSMIAKWEMQWKRSPSEKELQSLISQNIKQEIFYQEALKMNLDHNDEIIKRRLSQKMQFLSNDIAAMIEPTEQELEDYYKKHIDSYLEPTNYALYQIVFSPDNRKDTYNDAAKVLDKFKEAKFEEMEDKGDQLPFPYFYSSITANELGLQLGAKFSEALEKQELNKWVGPIASGFGYHLVYISTKANQQPQPFEQVKREVNRDYEYETQKNIDESIYQEFKKKYAIELDIQSEDFDPSYVKFLENEFNN